MKFNPFIFGSKKIIFNSLYSQEESEERLKNITETSAWECWDKTVVISKIKNNKVRMYRHRENIRNSFDPIFYGTLTTKDNKAILDGKFTLHWYTKIFFTIWFGGVFAAGLLALYIGITERGFKQLFPFFISVIVTGLAGLAIVLFGNGIARDSVDKISEVIETSFK